MGAVILYVLINVALYLAWLATESPLLGIISGGMTIAGLVIAALAGKRGD